MVAAMAATCAIPLSKWLVFIRPSLAGFDRPLTAVLADQAVEGVRQREDQMEIGRGQQRGRLLCQPGHGRRALTVRTMAVAATVGHDVFAPAMGTIEHLAAQRARPAAGQSAERFPLVGRKAQRRRRGPGKERTQDLPQGGARRHDVGGSWERSSSCCGPAIWASPP